MNRNLVARAATARVSRRIALGRLAGAGAAIALAVGQGPTRGAAQGTPLAMAAFAAEGAPMSQATPQATPSGDQMTVVLVHGAYADGSSWDGVVERLQAAGVPVMAPANPLRGLTVDTAYTASYINQIPGRVLAVAHSYAGAVITNACVATPNVVGLVFVDAFATEVGEAAGKVLSGSKDSILSTALGQLTYPVGKGTETATEFFVEPDKFRTTFAADLPAEQAAVLAATQRPAAEACFTEPTTAAAWKTLPCWAVFGSSDKAAGADIVRAQAERAGATITEVDGSHLLLISQPQVVSDVILTAIEAV